MKIVIDIGEPEMASATRAAYRYGFKRENPRKAWSNKEFKEAMRFLAERLFNEATKPMEPAYA